MQREMRDIGIKYHRDKKTTFIMFDFQQWPFQAILLYIMYSPIKLHVNETFQADAINVIFKWFSNKNKQKNAGNSYNKFI